MAFENIRTRQYRTRTLISRFLPYLLKYKGMLTADLACAALTTLCDIALPKIMNFLGIIHWSYRWKRSNRRYWW